MEVKIRKSYYDNGQLKFETSYFGEVLHGPSTSWHENGQIAWKENYKFGEKYGLSHYCNINGLRDDIFQLREGRIYHGPYIRFRYGS